jgi:predicted GH43/DUF377 family glycosyl hydrolase
MMIPKYEHNPILPPADVTPSHPGYRVLGAFNPEATLFHDEILLLLRVEEGCLPKEGKVRVPVYRTKNGGMRPDILEFDASDPHLDLSGSRGVGYKNKTYLSTVSHLRLARSTDGIHFTVDVICPFFLPQNRMKNMA